MSKRKVIITCAVTGGQTFNPKHPNFPITPQEIADAVAEAASAGASIAHCHVRDENTKMGIRSPELFKQLCSRIRDNGTDILINLTGGDGGLFLPDPEDESRPLPESDIENWVDRMQHIKECLPDIASLDVTTANQADGSGEYVYLNTPYTLRKMAKSMQELGVKPELECFQSGDLMFGQDLIDEGYIDGKPMFQFVLGIKWGAPALPETILYLRNLLPAGANWGAIGIAQKQFPIAAQSVLAGGNIRVGLEDNLYLDRGVFATNGALVERAVRIVEDMGYAVATPEEAREILDLPKKA